MSNVTVLLPKVNDVAYYEFKDPFDQQAKILTNSLDKRYKLRVVSVVSIVDYVTMFHRDPMMDVYNPVGLNEIEYRQDRQDDIKIVTFAYTDLNNVEHLFRVPHNYIAEVYDNGVIPYTNRTLVLNLGYLPEDLNLSYMYTDLLDLVTTMTGVSPSITDVSVGEREFVTSSDNEDREAIRRNNVTVNKTLSVQLEERNIELTEILTRLKELGISLE